MALSHSFSALKLYENCPLRYYEQRIKKSVVDKGGEASQYGERIHEALDQRLKGGAELPAEAAAHDDLVVAVQKMAARGQLLTEQKLTLTIDLQPTEWFAPDAWMRSILDILVLHDDHAFVLDWKTGKRRPDFTQLELFALQVFAHYPQIKSVSSGFIWLKDNAMDKETYTRADAPKLWAALLERIHRIEQSVEHDNWPARPSGLCRFCPCRNFCDYAA
jgi:hypothetical protein